MNKESHYQSLLDKKLKQSRYKQLKCILPLDHHNDEDKPLLNFSSGDFLSLSGHPFVKKNTIKYVLKWGAGSSASRLVTSHLERQYELEKRLATLLNKEATFFLNGTQNVHSLILTPLLLKEAVVFVDEEVSDHLKKAAKGGKGECVTFYHNTPSHLESLLENYTEHQGPKIIVSESIFHTGGNRAPITKLSTIAKKHGALLYMDDSLSFSVMGHQGFGLAAQKNGVDIAVSAFGRSSGAFGNFVASTKTVKEYLMHYSSEIAAITLLPPAALGAIDASLDLIPDMHEERERIAYLANAFRQSLKKLQIDTGPSDTHIIPLHLENEQELFTLSHHLVEEQILAQNLKNSGYSQSPSLRLIINANHSKEQIDTFTERLKGYHRPLAYEKAFH